MEHGDFKIASSTRIQLPEDVFMGGPWTHLATITRSLSEYVILLKGSSFSDPETKIYIEQITPTGRFLKIEDEALWRDLVYFATAKGLTSEISGKEIVFAR